MSRKRRKAEQRARNIEAPASGAGAFNQPFKEVARQLARRQAEAPAPPPPAPPPAVAATAEPDEDDLFLMAMEGVALLPSDTRKRAPEPKPLRLPDRPSEDEEALLQLSELVTGQEPIDIVDTDEHVEGAVHGLDPRVLKKLRKGEFAVAGHLDLHGKTRDEAREAVTLFVAKSRRDGKRCVLLVHGRGLHSKDQQPVLKEALVAWLGRSSLRRQILAFCTARPYDGGPGALYVLLRK